MVSTFALDSRFLCSIDINVFDFVMTHSRQRRLRLKNSDQLGSKCFSFTDVVRRRRRRRPKQPRNRNSGKRRVLSDADLKPILEPIPPKKNSTKQKFFVALILKLVHRKMILTQNFSLIEKKKMIHFSAREKSNGANCLLGNSLFAFS